MVSQRPAPGVRISRKKDQRFVEDILHFSDQGAPKASKTTKAISLGQKVKAALIETMDQHGTPLQGADPYDLIQMAAEKHRKNR